LKKAEKKIFNEDLVEVKDINPMSSDQKETTTNENKSNQITPAMIPNKSMDLRSKSLRRPINPVAFNKLEALKFKLSL
jgi:hypothetical protein